MELLIPGLILVALMVWASTKIKKTAADAFEAEFIETETYSLEKPEGFLHVIGDEDHAFAAYSREYGTNDNIGIRQATIEIDIFRDTDASEVVSSIENSSATRDNKAESGNVIRLGTEESANEIAIRGFYKIVATESGIYRLRFAVLPEHSDDYLEKVEETLGSFSVHTI